MASQASAPLLPQNIDINNMVETQQQGSRSEQGSRTLRGSHESLAQHEKSQSTDVHAQKIGGAILDIIWALICLSLPMLVLTAIFIGLVYGYEISNGSEASRNLLGTLPPQDKSAYYIDYSATRLITVSSWTSTVTSFTTCFVMILVSYPLAKDFLRKSNSGAPESLPTVYQLRLIIGLLEGGLGPLWSWLQYCFWKRRNKQTGLLWLAVISLVGATTLSLAILGADTWLHVTTSTINFDIVSPPASEPTSSYGRALMPSCYNGTYPLDEVDQCIGVLQLPGSVHLTGASEATRTLMNISTTNAALVCTLDNKSLAYLTAAQQDPNLDFKAGTYATSTTCTPASKACNLQQVKMCLREDGCPLGPIQISLAMTYNCSPSLYGNMNNNTGSYMQLSSGSAGTSSIGFFMQLFGKEGFSKPISDYNDGIPNPFYFAAGAVVPTSNALAKDPEAVTDDVQYNSAFIFGCSTTIYNLEYTSIDGNVVDGKYTEANETLSTNLGWPFLLAGALPQNNLESAFFGGAQQSNTSQEFADFFAQAFSRTAISMMVGITVESSNIAEQTKHSRLVTRLPKAPFFTLIILNLLYALVGIVLAIIALASQPKRTRDIQARLGIAGLVVALLEPNSSPPSKKSSGIESAFAEYCNDGKHDDVSRVVLVESGLNNCVFEKVSPQTEILDDKAATQTPNGGDGVPIIPDNAASQQLARGDGGSQLDDVEGNGRNSHDASEDAAAPRPDAGPLAINSAQTSVLSS